MDGCSGIGRNWLGFSDGIAFKEEGDLFICDNQGWSGAEKAQNKGRVLRLKFENDQLKETITVASGMEHPNGPAYPQRETVRHSEFIIADKRSFGIVGQRGILL